MSRLSGLGVSDGSRLCCFTCSTVLLLTCSVCENSFLPERILVHQAALTTLPVQMNSASAYHQVTMSNEIEIKYKVDGFEQITDALHAAGAVYLGKTLQTDDYYDTPMRDLLTGNRGLRIRQCQWIDCPTGQQAGSIDDRPLVTLKGPPTFTDGAKQRSEMQTHVDNAAAIEAVFAAATLELTLRIQKKRASYRLGQCMVELDELPGIGLFVEIESPDRDELASTAEKLKIAEYAQAIEDHYVNLILEWCEETGADRKEVMFK